MKVEKINEFFDDINKRFKENKHLQRIKPNTHVNNDQRFAHFLVDAIQNDVAAYREADRQLNERRNGNEKR